MNAERQRLKDDKSRAANWKRWGPYLSERQWGTVREDYSNDGSAWEHFSHDQARSRAYRWGEDGLMGYSDRQCRLCIAPALWNGQDPILKERLFGLTGNEGNHGEDVKELYYYLDSAPTHSYNHTLYYYCDDFKVEVPKGSGTFMNLKEASLEIERRLCSLFTLNYKGQRPIHDGLERYAKGNPDEDKVLFYEYFHGDTGRGVGASHQTGWTALIAKMQRDLSKHKDH